MGRSSRLAGADRPGVDSFECLGQVDHQVVGILDAHPYGTPTFFIDGVRYDGSWADPEGLERALSDAT
jgi:hypothetical protein